MFIEVFFGLKSSWIHHLVKTLKGMETKTSILPNVFVSCWNIYLDSLFKTTIPPCYRIRVTLMGVWRVSRPPRRRLTRAWIWARHRPHRVSSFPSLSPSRRSPYSPRHPVFHLFPSVIHSLSHRLNIFNFTPYSNSLVVFLSYHSVIHSLSHTLIFPSLSLPSVLISCFLFSFYPFLSSLFLLLILHRLLLTSAPVCANYHRI